MSTMARRGEKGEFHHTNRHHSPTITAPQLLVFLVLLLCSISRSASGSDSALLQEEEDHHSDAEYMVIGVSGGLQTGFPDHGKMHYQHENNNEVVRAIFVGRALIRGCKAFLDVMQPQWRQYSYEPEQPLINSVIMISGCHEHANQYWVYLVDARQFLSILNNEPRFLAITPDTGLVDLLSHETDDSIRHLAAYEIERRNQHLQIDTNNGTARAMDRTTVALPMVVATYYHDSFVPSPPIRIHDDGTHVTNFPESLALWAGVNDLDRIADIPEHSMDTVFEVDENSCQETHHRHALRADHDESAVLSSSHQNQHQRQQEEQQQQRYWNGIRAAIRHAEAHPLPIQEWKQNGPPWTCQQSTRLGTSKRQLRINYPFSRHELNQLFTSGGYYVDWFHGRLFRHHKKQRDSSNE